MEYIGDVLYDYASGLYVNLTNRCPCRCEFCIRDMVDSLGDADNLWLKSLRLRRSFFRFRLLTLRNSIGL